MTGFCTVLFHVVILPCYKRYTLWFIMGMNWWYCMHIYDLLYFSSKVRLHNCKKVRHNILCFHNYFDMHNILYLHIITIDISRAYTSLLIILIIHVQIWNYVFSIIDYIKLFVMVSAYNHKNKASSHHILQIWRTNIDAIDLKFECY